MHERGCVSRAHANRPLRLFDKMKHRPVITNQIKTLLGVEVKMAEAKLENGTIISSESFSVGDEIFIVTHQNFAKSSSGKFSFSHVFVNSSQVLRKRSRLHSPFAPVEPHPLPEVDDSQVAGPVALPAERAMVAVDTRSRSKRLLDSCKKPTNLMVIIMLVLLFRMFEFYIYNALDHMGWDA